MKENFTHLDSEGNPKMVDVGQKKISERTAKAMCTVSVAALTIYDMCKGFSHNIVISNIQLKEKTGGKNDFKRA